MSENTEEICKRLEFAVDAARRAGELILRYYQNPDLAIELKSDESPVTAADREILIFIMGVVCPVAP